MFLPDDENILPYEKKGIVCLLALTQSLFERYLVLHVHFFNYKQKLLGEYMLGGPLS